MTLVSAESTLRRIRWAAFALLVWLVALVLASGFAAAVLLSVAEEYADSAAFQLVLCLTGGTLGAALPALLSAGERIARGWSFGDNALAAGDRRFHARLAPLLAVQPILGAAVGMLLLLALSAGSVMLLRLSEGTTFDPMGLLLASSFAGLLSRGLLARLRDAADALFGARTLAAVVADPAASSSALTGATTAAASPEVLAAIRPTLTSSNPLPAADRPHDAEMPGFVSAPSVAMRPQVSAATVDLTR